MAMFKTVMIKKFESSDKYYDQIRALILFFLAGGVLGFVIGVMLTAP